LISRVAEIVESEVVFFVGEKMIGSVFDELHKIATDT
jgi:hypothetical protein